MLFNQSDNLYEQGLAVLESGLVIAPSPQMADIIRRRLAPHNSNIDVLTISKFLRDELGVLVGDDVSENYRGKSELLLLLSTLWKKLEIPESSYELFQRCFKLLTDLRSFSMSSDVLETALEHFDENIALGTIRMHQVLEHLDIYDEHRSYFQLSEQLRSGDIPITYETERNLVFLGFDFLSASQVDLLKAYSIRDNVIVPAYEQVYNSLSDLDWLKWLDVDGTEKDVIDSARDKVQLRYSNFPKNYLSKALKQELEQPGEENTQVVLGERNSSFEKIQQAILLPSSFKSPVEILDDKIEWLYNQLVQKNIVETPNLLSELDEVWESLVEQQDFRGLRAVQLMKSIVTGWKELSDDNETVTSFDYKILKEALKLDAPRVFQTTLSSESLAVELKSLKELDDVKGNYKKIFCISSEFSSPKTSVTQYTEGVEKYLGSIGPLRRAELEFVALQEKLMDALDEKSFFLIEEGALGSDQGWSSFFEKVESTHEQSKLEFGKKSSYEESPVARKDLSEDRLSATRLQTYLDCPKKFYFKYALDYQPRYKYEDRLDPLELGQIQHATIENYVDTFKSYVFEEHEKLVLRMISEHSKSKNLDNSSLVESKLETINNTKRVIEGLFEIKSKPGVSVLFEQKIKESGISGSIDCIIETQEDILLLDFKRGAGSIPSQTAFKKFDKIQLWFYANHWSLKDKRVALGYICLSDLEMSQIYYSSDDSKALFKGILEARSVSLSKNFSELFEAYKKYESDSYSKLLNDSSFPARPLEPKICNYCDLNKICSRTSEGVGNV